ncbi:MAG: methyltransferase domain-containing protein [Planctomycetota bacterium]
MSNENVDAELVSLNSEPAPATECCNASNNDSTALNYEAAVAKRYSGAAEAQEAALCCPVEYRQDLLEVIPQEIMERDYGCGDPSPYVNEGETVLDLGSGGGKLCYIASQVVGPKGKVIGVDCNLEMLDLARKYQNVVAEKIGFSNVTFRCGVIQNLALDLEQLSEEVGSIEQSGVGNLLERRRLEQRLERETPMIPDSSVDCVVSNCVLNLVQPEDRRRLFKEIHRVLKKGGRAAISDIVADEDVPESMQQNPELWSGCISGAWREDQFLEEFEKAGFYGIQIAKRVSEPWQIVEGIEFRSITVISYKGKEGPCLECNQALIYKGPFKSVVNDDGQTFFRGERMAVCDKTYQMATQAPYRDSFVPVQPRVDIPLDQAADFDCNNTARRHPRESKGLDYQETRCCESDEGCC